MDEIPFRPQFNRYPPAITSHIVRIARAQSTIDAAMILPPQDDILRVSALAETVHFSTLLERNSLTQIEAERAVRRTLDARGAAEIELLNYVAALEHIEGGPSTISYDVDFIRKLHGLITRGLGLEGTDFAPRHEGEWRDGEAVIPNRMREIEHVGVPAGDELDARMRGLSSYLERHHQSVEYPGPILAAVAHHAITDLHPFADGNGRLARVFAFAVLIRERVMIRRLVSPDRHYALNKPAYLAALRSAKRLGESTDRWTSPANLEPWLLYYTSGLADECDRMASRVAELNRVAEQVKSAPIQLTSTQEHVISVLSAGDRASISRREYEDIERVGSDRAQREIAALTRAQLLSATGRGRGVRYRLPTTNLAATRWNDQTIEAALRQFLKSHDAWPARQEFVDAGLGALYVAMSRYGGIRTWRSRMRM